MMRFFTLVVWLALCLGLQAPSWGWGLGGQPAPAPAAFDPLEFDVPDTDIVFPAIDTTPKAGRLPEKDYVIIHVDSLAWEEEKKLSRSLEEDAAHKLGYRIQIYTTTALDTALAMKDSVNRVFRLPVYLEHDAPHYKIRLGNFLTPAEAHEVLDKIAGRYREAWVVRSEICAACRAAAPDQEIFAVDSTATVDSTTTPKR